MFARALEAGRRVAELPKPELAAAHEALADCLYRVGELPKAADAYSSALRLSRRDSLRASELLLKRSKLEEKLGKYQQALRWAGRASKALKGLDGDEARRQSARTNAWFASVLQSQGRHNDAIHWAGRAIRDAGSDESSGSGGPVATCRVCSPQGGRTMAQSSLYERLGGAFNNFPALGSLQ